MQTSDLNNRIIAQGKALFDAIADEKPALFNSATWTGRVMEWCLANSAFKTSLLRFVDVFPVLQGHEQVTSHIRQYFGEDQELPPVLARGVRMAGKLGGLGGAVLAKLISANMHEMAKQFILAEQPDELLRGVATLHRQGFACALDVLGEATLSQAEADQYLQTYLELLQRLSAEKQNWPVLPGLEQAPTVHLAVKPTAFFPLTNPMDFEGSVNGILAPLRLLAQQVVKAGAFLCIDMEAYRYKGITLELYRRIKREFPDYPHIGLALQAYLRDSEADLAELLAWARAEAIPLSIRLVKGAYWDYETVKARQMGWPVPVHMVKAESDASFERMAATILANHEICHFACASHNIRSIAAVLETARSLKVPETRYEFQMLYGMAEPVRRGILGETGRVRLYCPCGQMVPGMGYLVRRLLENTANESFLRLKFSEKAEQELLLQDPAQPQSLVAEAELVPTGFVNEPAADFTQPAVRQAFEAAIASLRQKGSQTVGLLINGKEVITSELLPSYNPNQPSELLGQVCQAGPAQLEQAISAASTAFPAWRDTPATTRAACLRQVAALLRQEIYEQAALQVLEVGKQWDQAHADVTEAIDFLEYYASEMLRLAAPCSLGSLAGEENQLVCEGRGVAVVIAPWNFPLAIACGMVSAALVSGNTVLFKPSGLSSLIGRRLVELFAAAGLPDGVLNFVPGRGSVIGDQLVDHPKVALVAFTGSMEVGLRIVNRASVTQPGQRQIKRVIAELGGKNAMIIDDDADLDEAVPQVLASAFGFQGQKCSACSRVIVLDAMYDRFVTRLVEAAKAWLVGPAESPRYAMGAVIDAAAQQKIRDYLAIGQQEGQLLYQSPVPQAEGYWVPLSIFGNIRPEHRLAQEEIFGPVLSVMRAADFEQALDWANSSSFALTGGLFSRSPEHIARAGQAFRVGNLYINRSITGAMVGRQPFGGAGLSGVGTKAGGPDYLLHFMDQRVITENTMRRGFTPHKPAAETA